MQRNKISRLTISFADLRLLSEDYQRRNLNKKIHQLSNRTEGSASLSLCWRISGLNDFAAFWICMDREACTGSRILWLKVNSVEWFYDF